MPFYTKPIAQLDTSDLQELLDEQAIENVRLEFTRKEENKAETLKKLSSFANTFGGYLLVGGFADSKDGRLQSLPGIGTLPSYGQPPTQGPGSMSRTGVVHLPQVFAHGMT